MLFDSHCHLTDARLFDDADGVVTRARESGVTRMVTIGAEPGEFDRAIALARRFDGVWATVGVHPHVADRMDDAVLEDVVELARADEVVGLGETGLDYHYDHAPRHAQRQAFLRHLELAEALSLPVVVHSRDADADTAAVIRDAASRVRGVLHCFAGGRSLLDAAIDAGWYISFSGLVTFRNYEGDDLVRAVPLDRILIETDSPYLAPVPLRGKCNEPAYVRFVTERVAEIRGLSFDALASATTANACALYGIAP